MRAVIHVKNQEELKRFYKKRRPINVHFPKLEQRKVYIMLACALIVFIVATIGLYQLGYHDGSRSGYNLGFDKGYNAAVKEVLATKELSFKEAIFWNIRLKLDRYVWWFGVVVGISWIFHGVGFHFIKTG